MDFVNCKNVVYFLLKKVVIETFDVTRYVCQIPWCYIIMWKGYKCTDLKETSCIYAVLLLWCSNLYKVWTLKLETEMLVAIYISNDNLGWFCNSFCLSCNIYSSLVYERSSFYNQVFVTYHDLKFCMCNFNLNTV